MESYRTIAARFRFEPEKTKGSRHIATIAPLTSETDVELVLDDLRAEFPAANHHAYAWRLGRTGTRHGYSDDGEPSGSAGKPILAYLEGRDLTNVILVVSRIFGGTKLGVGGLVRAYGGAAAAALDAAVITTVVPKARLHITFPYDCTNAVQAIVHPRETTQLAADYGERVAMTLEVLDAEAAELARELTDGTAGQATIEVERTGPAD